MVSRQLLEVSIQLISPASGERIRNSGQKRDWECFHSTNFPSEWGVHCL